MKITLGTRWSCALLRLLLWLMHARQHKIMLASPSDVVYSASDGWLCSDRTFSAMGGAVVGRNTGVYAYVRGDNVCFFVPAGVKSPAVAPSEYASCFVLTTLFLVCLCQYFICVHRICTSWTNCSDSSVRPPSSWGVIS